MDQPRKRCTDFKTEKHFIFLKLQAGTKRKVRKQVCYTGGGGGGSSGGHGRSSPHQHQQDFMIFPTAIVTFRGISFFNYNSVAESSIIF